MALARSGLVMGTFGNVSGIDRAAGLMAIKPSGVPYDELKPEHIVPVSLSTGKVVGSGLRPSSDTPTHLELYRAFPSCGGIVHTHSESATALAQAGLPIRCLGTTHADHFRGDVPVTRALTRKEVASDYEENTGLVIVETFRKKRLSAEDVAAVLVRNHGPFAWGKDAAAAVENAQVLEYVARMEILVRATGAHGVKRPARPTSWTSTTCASTARAPTTARRRSRCVPPACTACATSASTRRSARSPAPARCSCASRPSASAARTCTGSRRAGSGSNRITRPIVPGHEMAGRTEDGRLVAIEPAIPCERCSLCLEGHPNLCPTIRFSGQGDDDGSMREWMAWPEHCLFPLPDGFTAADGAMLEPLGVAIHTVDLAHVRPGVERRRLRLRADRPPLPAGREGGRGGPARRHRPRRAGRTGSTPRATSGRRPSRPRTGGRRRPS